MELSGKNIKFKYQTEKESKMTDQIIELNKKIRMLEIEIDYVEETESHNFKYIRELNNQLDALYETLESLQPKDE